MLSVIEIIAISLNGLFIIMLVGGVLAVIEGHRERSKYDRSM